MKIVGIIGDPIRHSLSPAMHNAAFRRMNLPFLYLPFRVPQSELGSFLQRAKRWRVAGLNVTIPHKEEVIRHLDRISPEAAVIGAVNTVATKKGKMVGYNTDAEGFLLSLKLETGFQVRGKRVLILGAGGAARSVIYALAKGGVRKIALCNRTPSRAGRLVRLFRKKFKQVQWEGIPLKAGVLSEIFPTVDLLVNTTSVGLNGTRFRGIPLARLPKKAVVSDLVYRPLMTPLLKEARRHGLKIHPGWGMLLHQGALSFRIWTGRRPDLKVMKKALIDALIPSE